MSCIVDSVTTNMRHVRSSKRMSLQAVSDANRGRGSTSIKDGAGERVSSIFEGRGLVCPPRAPRGLGIQGSSHFGRRPAIAAAEVRHKNTFRLLFAIW